MLLSVVKGVADGLIDPLHINPKMAIGIFAELPQPVVLTRSSRKVRMSSRLR
jgi:hypothetical protein